MGKTEPAYMDLEKAYMDTTLETTIIIVRAKEHPIKKTVPSRPAPIKSAIFECRFANFDVRIVSCDWRFEICDLRVASCELRFAICKLRSATFDLCYAMCSVRFAVRDSQIAFRDL